MVGCVSRSIVYVGMKVNDAISSSAPIVVIDMSGPCVTPIPYPAELDVPRVTVAFI